MGKREEVNAKVTKFFFNTESKENFFDVYCKTKKKNEEEKFLRSSPLHPLPAHYRSPLTLH